MCSRVVSTSKGTLYAVAIEGQDVGTIELILQVTSTVKSSAHISINQETASHIRLVQFEAVILPSCLSNKPIIISHNGLQWRTLHLYVLVLWMSQLWSLPSPRPLSRGYKAVLSSSPSPSDVFCHHASFRIARTLQSLALFPTSAIMQLLPCVLFVCFLGNLRASVATGLCSRTP